MQFFPALFARHQGAIEVVARLIASNLNMAMHAWQDGKRPIFNRQSRANSSACESITSCSKTLNLLALMAAQNRGHSNPCHDVYIIGNVQSHGPMGLLLALFA